MFNDRCQGMLWGVIYDYYCYVLNATFKAKKLICPKGMRF